MVGVMCNKCFNIRLFSAIATGVMSTDPEPVAHKTDNPPSAKLGHYPILTS